MKAFCGIQAKSRNSRYTISFMLASRIASGWLFLIRGKAMQ